MGSAETTSKRGPIGRAIYERKGRPLEGRYGEWANGRMGENGAFEDEDDDEEEYEVRLALHAQQPVDARFLRGLELQTTFDGGCDKRQIVSGQPPADKGDQ